MPEDVYKFYYMLLTNHPVLRGADYYSITLRNFNRQNENYISFRRHRIIFNKVVKSKNIKLPLTILLNQDEKELLKNVIKNNKTDYLRGDDTLSHFKNVFRTRNKKYFNLPKGISIFRRYFYSKLKIDKNVKEQFMKILNIAKQQNHSLETTMMYYV